MVAPSVSMAAVSAARPSLPGGSFCEPAVNENAIDTVGSSATGSRIFFMRYCAARSTPTVRRSGVKTRRAASRMSSGVSEA